MHKSDYYIVTCDRIISIIKFFRLFYLFFFPLFFMVWIHFNFMFIVFLFLIVHSRCITIVCQPFAPFAGHFTKSAFYSMMFSFLCFSRQTHMCISNVKDCDTDKIKKKIIMSFEHNISTINNFFVRILLKVETMWFRMLIFLVYCLVLLICLNSNLLLDSS